MRHVYLAALAAILAIKPCVLFSASTFTLPEANVGSNLETAVSVSLSHPAPAPGLDITLRSSDPARLLFSKLPDQTGTASFVVRARPGFSQSQDFWIQGFGSPGTVSYTASAAGFDTVSGMVTVSPSGVVIRGPWAGPKFVTTTGSAPSRITLTSVRLASTLKSAGEQYIAAGISVRVEVISSNPDAGTIVQSPLEMKGGTDVAATLFRPAGEGDTTLSVQVRLASGEGPPGFSVPAESATVVASVQKPRIAVSDDLVIGKNLQLGGVLALAEPAPASGVDVTLVSDDPSKMLISDSPTKIGSKSVTLKFLPGKTVERYSLQALGDSGTVKYTATAPGFQSRTGIVTLTPSGAVITLSSQGPPDEAHVLRKDDAEPITPSFETPLSPPSPIRLVVWTLQLHPITLRGADITTQALRPGLSLTVPLANSNPAVGRMVSSVTIQGGSDHAITEFTPLSVGSTEISVMTPQGFSPSANSTKLIAIVNK
jgi:hypothetical protein